MALHDWTRVPAGIYHHFHNAWITQLSDWLNSGSLPDDYYAVGEQRAGDIGPDVLTLRESRSDDGASVSGDSGTPSAARGESLVAVIDRPPQVENVEELDSELAFYSSRQRQVSIRHVSGDELIAIIEIVSPANKHSRREIDKFVTRIAEAIDQGVHCMVLDPFPPGSADRDGIHVEISRTLGGEENRLVLGDQRNRAFSAYDAGQRKAYIQSLGVDSPLPQMPLFLRTGQYINVDLDTTYQRAYQFFPRRFKNVLESAS